MNKKKWIFGIFVGAVVVAFVCAVILGVFKKDEPKAMTFEEAVAEDVAYAKTVDNYVCWYEVEAKLNAGLDSTALEDLKMTEYTLVYQVTDTVHYLYRNMESGEVTDSCEPGHWAGTFSMDKRVEDVTIPFDEALKMLKSQDSIPVPEGQFMTFRCPFGDETSHPSYLFGSIHTSIVFVDAVNGNIFPSVKPDENKE